jgi:hypothetical protein
MRSTTRIRRYAEERIWWRLLDIRDWVMRRDTRAPAVPVVRPVYRRTVRPRAAQPRHSRRKRLEWALADRWRDLTAAAALLLTLVATAVVLASEGGGTTTTRVADATASSSKTPDVTTVAVKGVAENSPAVDLAAEQRKLKRRELRKQRDAIAARHHKLEQKHNALKRKKRANARERARTRRARSAQSTPSTPATPSTPTTTPSTPTSTTPSTPTYTPPTHSTPTHTTPTHTTPTQNNSGNSGSVFDDQG